VIGSAAYDDGEVPSAGVISSSIRRSRDIRFVAAVSSSISSRPVPISSASTIAAACDVEPDALSLEKLVVSATPRTGSGTPSMNGEMSTRSTRRPSSARIVTASARVTTSSRPSPGTWSYTPARSAASRVDLPWKPPPTTRLTPAPSPMPVTRPRLGRSTSTRSSAGEAKGTTASRDAGRSSMPVRRASTAPSPTKATRPRSASSSRNVAASSTDSTKARAAAWSSTGQRRAASASGSCSSSACSTARCGPGDGGRAARSCSAA
jgi:hypothetical protein